MRLLKLAVRQGVKNLTHAFFVLCLFLICANSVFALDASYLESPFVKASTPLDSAFTQDVYLVVGELAEISVHSLTRISVTDPGIADILEAKEGIVNLIAKQPGQTALFIWDENGKVIMTIHVSNQDLGMIKDRVKNLLVDAGIKEVTVQPNEDESKVVLSGDLPEYKREAYESIKGIFKDNIIDLVGKEELLDLIQVDMQVTELSTTLSKNLGIKWSPASATGSTDGDLALNYKEDQNTKFDGSIGDFFKIGDFRRDTFLQAKVNALIEEGKARILSKPKIVVASGQEAKFLVGGEVPIRTTTTSTGGASTQENVQFKSFGVGMTLTPTIRKGKINVVLNVQISDIDRANSAGSDIAFETRTASTNLNLDDGQLVVLAGLIKHNESETLSRVPFLSKIPIAGILFRNRKTPAPNQDQEVVISLVPTILKSTRAPSAQAKYSENKVVAHHPTQGEAKIASEMPSAGEDQAQSVPAEKNKSYVGIPKDMEDYVRQIQRQISQSIIYPREAQEQGLEGTVRLGMLILRDGTLAYASVQQSSGSAIIDDYALNTAKNTAPYAGFPPTSKLEEINVVVPIVYSLKRN